MYQIFWSAWIRCQLYSAVGGDYRLALLAQNAMQDACLIGKLCYIREACAGAVRNLQRLLVVSGASLLLDRYNITVCVHRLPSSSPPLAFRLGAGLFQLCNQLPG